jgi:ATP adenylyltransferase
MADANENLWAPWRMEYIRSLDGEGETPGECFFCKYRDHAEHDRTHHMVWRSDHAFVVMNRFPYTNGHLMVALHRHEGDPDNLQEAELYDLTRLTWQAVKLLRAVIKPQGFNVGSNVGRCAGAGVPDHLHTHIVPRWGGDTNFMSVVGGVRVIPDSLDALYEEMIAAAAKLGFRE